MPRHRWSPDVVFRDVVLTPTERACPTCGGFMHICDHRHRQFYTFDDPIHLNTKLVHCIQPDCPTRSKTYSSPEEMGIALPRWLIAWDVFAWIGHRRFARDWSIPQIQAELRDTHGISLSTEGLCSYARRYQTMVAARHQDLDRLKEDYANVDDLILTIDGLQPEKGHEVLYVVRELRLRRVWFATPLLSSATAEIETLLREAQQWASALGKPIAAWVSDKQHALVRAIANVFPELPHRYCHNHFLRGLTKPMMQQDNQAKVKMRKEVRGLRAIERTVTAAAEPIVTATAEPTVTAAAEPTDAVPSAPVPEPSLSTSAPVPEPSLSTSAPVPEPEPEPSLPTSASVSESSLSTSDQQPTAEDVASVVLDYCAATRGVLNANYGGPLDPPGLRMDEGLEAIGASLKRCLEEKKGVCGQGAETAR